MFSLFIEILAAGPAEFLYGSDLGWIEQLRDEINSRDSVRLRALPVFEVRTVFPIFVLHGSAPIDEITAIAGSITFGLSYRIKTWRYK